LAQQCLAEDQMCPIGIGGEFVPHGRGVAVAQLSEAGRQLGQRVVRRRHDDAGPGTGTLQLDARGQRREQARVQQGRLTRPGCAGYDDHAGAGQAPRQHSDQLGHQPLPTAEHLGMLLVEGQQSPVRASGVPARPVAGLCGLGIGLREYRSYLTPQDLGTLVLRGQNPLDPPVDLPFQVLWRRRLLRAASTDAVDRRRDQVAEDGLRC
jgi:hypothetical protein